MKNRLIAVAIMAGVLFTGAACDNSGDTTTATGSTSAAATSAAATSAPASGGTGDKASCAKAEAAVGTAITRLLNSATTTVQQAGSDQQAVQKAIQTAVTQFVADLQAANGGVEDPAVKAALTEWITVVSKKAGTMKSLQDVDQLQNIDSDPEVAAANAKLTALCG